ncbi:6-bladed beta-propeller [Aliifodinibius sp. S!AR15-10]|uniref:6-bladed beta-propeller n=1 Tax=Aliifodinibius sp. S!AR15-10 TaxID=2950437 RepID=UPI002857C556|nr:6-bladed beta-propeller [Aliifodinibius sp. S!AR15-10]MDR8393824.1 6-bladed beta-propeller [Aliifodinibius sp. S!AR15-10]
MTLQSRGILFIVILIMAVGCSNQPESQVPNDIKIPEHLKKLENLTVYEEDSKPVHDIQLERTASYGSSEEEYVLVGGPEGTLARVDHRGRVFIPDRRQQVIHVLGPQGDYITHIGRKGRGPGEFEIISDIGIGSTYFYAYDSDRLRINVFSLDSLAFSHTINLDRTDWEGNARRLGDTGGFFVLDEQTLLKELAFSLPDNFKMWDNTAVLDSNSYRYYTMNHEGELTSGEIFRQKRRQWTLYTFRGGTHATHLPIHGKPLMTVSQDGRIFSARSGEFLIKVHDPDGQYLRAFYHPYKGPVFHRSNRKSEPWICLTGGPPCIPC